MAPDRLRLLAKRSVPSVRGMAGHASGARDQFPPPTGCEYACRPPSGGQARSPPSGYPDAANRVVRLIRTRAGQIVPLQTNCGSQSVLAANRQRPVCREAPRSARRGARLSRWRVAVPPRRSAYSPADLCRQEAYRVQDKHKRRGRRRGSFPVQVRPVLRLRLLAREKRTSISVDFGRRSVSHPKGLVDIAHQAGSGPGHQTQRRRREVAPRR